MHNEKITKLEQQFFYLAQNKSKDQQAPAHKAKIRNISLQKVFQHSSCSNSGHGSGSEASACFSSNSAMSNKSTPKKVQRPSKHRQSHKASHKRGKKKRTPPPHCTRKQVFQLMRFSKQLRTIIVF